MRVLIAVIVLIGIVITPVFGEIEFEARYWMPDLDSNVTYKGTEIDLKADLGVGDEDFPEGKLSWNTGADSRVSLDYLQAGFDGDSVLSRTFEFDGQTYTAGARVTSEFNLAYAGIDWIWQFINCCDNAVKAGTVIGARGAFGDLQVDAPQLGISESEDFTGALPVLGLAVDITPVKQLVIFGQASGMTGGRYGHLIDAEAGVRVIPFKYLSISGGYRIVDARFKDDPDHVEVNLKGPFAAVSARF